MPAALDTAEREFLRTLARAEPDWSLLDTPHLEELPAVRWKLQNLQQLAVPNTKKFRWSVHSTIACSNCRERDRSEPLRSTASRPDSSHRAEAARRGVMIPRNKPSGERLNG